MDNRSNAPNHEIKALLAAAYSAGMLDAAASIDRDITTDEIRWLTQELAESYAITRCE